MSGTWTKSSDGHDDIYATESGLVGAFNSHSCWVAWIPGANITYETEYAGVHLLLKTSDYQTYVLKRNGVLGTYRYAARWKLNTLYDAAGNAIANAEATRLAGDPQNVFRVAGQPDTLNRTDGSGSKVSLPLILGGFGLLFTLLK